MTHATKSQKAIQLPFGFEILVPGPVGHYVVNRKSLYCEKAQDTHGEGPVVHRGYT